MAKDIFGYDNKVNSNGRVLSSSMVAVAVSEGTGGGGSTYIALAQNVRVNYARTMTPVYEIGSDMILFSANGAQGTVNITRAVGEGLGGGKSGSLLSPFAPKDPCAYQTVTVRKSDKASPCGANPGTVTSVGMMQSVGLSIQAGNALVTDEATYNIISLSQG